MSLSTANTATRPGTAQLNGMPTASGQHRWRDDISNRIVEAGLELLLVADIGEIEMVDVAAEAGVSVSTVYRLFGSKSELLGHVLQRWIERFPLDTRVPREPDCSNGERSFDLLAAIVNCFEERPQVLRAFAAFQASDGSTASEQWAVISRTASEIYRSELSGIDDTTADAIWHLLAAALSAELRDWLAGRKEIGEVYANLYESVAVVFHYAG